MPVYVDLKLSSGSDTPSLAQKRIIFEAAEALSLALRNAEEVVDGEGQNGVGLFITNPIYPEVIYMDGEEDHYGCIEGRDAIKEERRQEKIKALKLRNELRKYRPDR